MIPDNIAKVVLDYAEEAGQTKAVTLTAHDETPVETVVAKTGIAATVIQGQLDAFAAIPRSRAGKVNALDLDSFAQLILRDYDVGSVVFADVSGKGVTFEAVLDYHQPKILHPDKRGGQRHGRETVVYAPALSDEWVAWTGQAGKAMHQAEFAEWIDEHLPDIADPKHLLAADMAESAAVKFGQYYRFTADQSFGYADPEAMIKVSQGFAIRENAVVKSTVKLASGEVSIQYQTEHTDGDGKPLTVPTRFLLSIPVFKREAAYLVPVKLSYRKAGGNLTWSFELFRPDRFRDDAIEGMRAELAKMLTPIEKVPAIEPVVPTHLAKRVTANG